ncbi:Fms-interacting protein-domain-containing protein [Chytriomyces sp. MP71]|nr:Fms-interacting protein-domain-containing protein [Chytriomyces sp. MP71]
MLPLVRGSDETREKKNKSLGNMDEDQVLTTLRASAQSLAASAGTANADPSRGNGTANGVHGANTVQGNSGTTGATPVTPAPAPVKKTAYARPNTNNANAVAPGGLGASSAGSVPVTTLPPPLLPPPAPPGAAATAAASFMALLELSRASHAASRAAKAQTADAKAALDAAALHERNLMYERDHLRREIAKMRAFESIYQDIPLMPLAQFLALERMAASQGQDTMLLDAMADVGMKDLNANADVDAAANLFDSNGNPVNDAAHALMLRRLEFELKERKRLKTDEDSLLVMKERIMKENEEKRAELEALDKEMEVLLKATIPLQERFGMPITRRREQAVDAQLLARPLFVLYQEIVNYNTLAEDGALHDRLQDC